MTLTDQILLFSGGTDSFIAWLYLKKPKVLYCHLKTKYSDIEAKRVSDLASTFNMDLTISHRLDLGDQEFKDASGFVPLRNSFLLMIASFYSNQIWYAGLGSDVVVDKNPEYSKEMSKFLTEQYSYRTKEVVVDSPFWSWTKEDTIRWVIKEYGFKKAHEMLLKTFSCYSDSQKPCGKCQACFRRFVALGLHCIYEEYQVSPLEGCREVIENKYIPEMIKSLKGEGKYMFRRAIETLGLIVPSFSQHPLVKENFDLIIQNLKIERERIIKECGVVPNYSLVI